MKFYVVCVLLCGLFVLSQGAGVSSKLYALDATLQLCTVDPNTGAMKAIGPRVITHEAQGENLASLDSKNGIFYFVGLNLTSHKIALVGLSIHDASIVHEVELPFISSVFVGVGEICDVDTSTGDVIVMGRDPSVQLDHHLLRVAPKTGAIKSLTHFALVDLLGAGHGYDPEHHVMWIQMALNVSGQVMLRMYGFDGHTGQALFIIDDLWGFSFLQYDRKTSKIVGLGTDLTKQCRFVAFLDSMTGEFSRKGDITDYFIAAPMRTFDIKNRLLYAWLEPKDGPKNQIDMVEIDIDTVKVVQAPTACAQLPKCPWSVECLNV